MSLTFFGIPYPRANFLERKKIGDRGSLRLIFTSSNISGLGMYEFLDRVNNEITITTNTC
jgi:hypothetical protein